MYYKLITSDSVNSDNQTHIICEDCIKEIPSEIKVISKETINPDSVDYSEINCTICWGDR